MPATRKTSSRKPQRAFRKAPVLTAAQFQRAIDKARATDHPLRNEAILRLSFQCGLRVGEIAGLQWRLHVTDVDGKVGDVLRISRSITKGTQRTVSRDLPIAAELKAVLSALREARPADNYVVYALAAPRRFTGGQRARNLHGGTDANTLTKFLSRLYEDAMLEGVTSHSGRRTFVTTLARSCNLAGYSLKDVQQLAGHTSLESTREYIDEVDAKAPLIAALFQAPEVILADAVRRRQLAEAA